MVLAVEALAALESSSLIGGVVSVAVKIVPLCLTKKLASCI